MIHALRAAILAFVLVFAGSVSAQQSSLTVKGITFFDHHTAGMIEQDGFVETSPGSSQVIRVSKDDAGPYLDRPLYGAAVAVHHAPFNAALNGPHAKGTPIGLTLGQWLAATGAADYSCTANSGTIDASFEGLVPDGVYTMWNFYAGKAHMGCADCPFATVDFPVGAADGSQSVFNADPNGNATFSATFSPCLQLGSERLVAGLAIAYHSDGRTWGPTPGELGAVSHVQIFTVLPDAGAERLAAK